MQYEVRPEDKLAVVKALAADGGVLMVRAPYLPYKPHATPGATYAPQIPFNRGRSPNAISSHNPHSPQLCLVTLIQDPCSLIRNPVGAKPAEGWCVQVGEGINDAPALAAATVGVVVADCASATSQEVADVLLLGSSAGVSNLPFLTYKVTFTNPRQRRDDSKPDSLVL